MQIIVEDKSTPWSGLEKVPDDVLLKASRQEVGKWRSYAMELEDTLKVKSDEIDELKGAVSRLQLTVEELVKALEQSDAALARRILEKTNPKRMDAVELKYSERLKMYQEQITLLQQALAKNKKKIKRKKEVILQELLDELGSTDIVEGYKHKVRLLEKKIDLMQQQLLQQYHEMQRLKEK